MAARSASARPKAFEFPAGWIKRSEFLSCNCNMPIFPADDDHHIGLAAARLRAGGLVAFATETVYGLGANALDGEAVKAIYALKGRPAFNPLIVHVANTQGARELTSGWNERAQILSEAFWPGPLTLVLPKTEAIPSLVSAGLETVALRVPASDLAQKLLRAAQIPLAAPSANRSGEISPTLAAHVRASLGDDLWVLDGGACDVGIESTVVDVSGEKTAILRPGSLSAREIGALVGPLVEVSEENDAGDVPRASPGQLLRHYAPRASLQVFSNLTEAHFQAVASRAARLGVIAFTPTPLEAHCELILPLDAPHYARQLYAALRQLDGEAGSASCDWILVEEPPLHPDWAGVRDRLQRAAHD